MRHYLRRAISYVVLASVGWMATRNTTGLQSFLVAAALCYVAWNIFIMRVTILAAGKVIRTFAKKQDGICSDLLCVRTEGHTGDHWEGKG